MQSLLVRLLFGVKTECFGGGEFGGIGIIGRESPPWVRIGNGGIIR